MENNRTSDVLGSIDNVVAMPSGLEVESARLHLPTESGGQHSSGLTRPAWREKLDTIRSRSMSGLRDVKSRSISKLDDVKSLSSRKISSMRGSVTGSMSRTEHHLRTHPTMWAGAAMGAGFTLGLLGRLALWRKQHEMPDVIVISGA